MKGKEKKEKQIVSDHGYVGLHNETLFFPKQRKKLKENWFIPLDCRCLKP